MDDTMKKFRFKKIDAFTTGVSPGNPAGCVYPDEEMTDGEMQQIARELKGFVSEVGFVRPGTGDVDFIFRYFSSEREVGFCGHATVACMYDLIRLSPSLQNRDIIRIRTNGGVLQVKNRVSSENMVYIHAPFPEFIDNPQDISEIASALGLPPSDIDDTKPLQIVHVGQNILVVPLKTLSACIRCFPDFEVLRKFALSNSVEVIHISTPQTEYRDNGFRVRVFAPAFGYLEDPATGSANAAFGYNLIRAGLWDGKQTVLEQGPDQKNPNIVCISEAPDNSILFGGGGVVRIEGQYYLY